MTIYKLVENVDIYIYIKIYHQILGSIRNSSVSSESENEDFNESKDSFLSTNHWINHMLVT